MTSGSSVSLESPITGCGASIPQNFAVRAISQSRKDCRKDRYHIGNKSRSPSLQVQQGWLVHSRGIPTKRGDYPRLILELWTLTFCTSWSCWYFIHVNNPIYWEDCNKLRSRPFHNGPTIAMSSALKHEHMVAMFWTFLVILSPKYYCNNLNTCKHMQIKCYK